MQKTLKTALLATTLIATASAFAQTAPAPAPAATAPAPQAMPAAQSPAAKGPGMATGTGFGPGPSMTYRQQPDIAKLLNLDAARSEKINAILADERTARKTLSESRKSSVHDDASRKAYREKVAALRESTQTKLNAVLTADEQKKLADSIAQRKLRGSPNPLVVPPKAG